MLSGSGARIQMPAYTELLATQAAAVQNTWYAMFTGNNIAFDGVAIGITVADETVEVRVTIDGVLIDCAAGVNLLFATNFLTQIGVLRFTTGAGVITLGAPAAEADTNPADIFWLRGRSVLIEARKTTAAGASAITIRGIYHKIP